MDPYPGQVPSVINTQPASAPDPSGYVGPAGANNLLLDSVGDILSPF